MLGSVTQFMETRNFLKKKGLISILPLIPALVAIFDAIYLPHFLMGQYFQLLQYLQFRAYVFLLLFVVTGVVTLFLVSYQPSWFTATLGISLCLIPINMVYLWTSFAIPRLEILFYSVSEDPSLIISSSYYDWFTLTIAVLIVLIAGTQSFKSRSSLVNMILHAGIFGAIALFPLGIEIYIFDRPDFTNHVANIMLVWLTNADLLYASTTILILCVSVLLYQKWQEIPKLSHSQEIGSTNKT